MMTNQTLLFIICFFLSASTVQDRLSGACVGVADGDTITILTEDKRQHKIRLAHIDCPEKGQPYGTRAKQFTSNFCFRKQVVVVSDGKKDRNGRIIGEVFNEQGENLNKALVRAGLAWHYKKYSQDASYAGLEERARAARKGLWQDPDPVEPWVWRKNR
jgi:endonuclease YncB( thermonuclease family)